MSRFFDNFPLLDDENNNKKNRIAIKIPDECLSKIQIRTAPETGDPKKLFENNGFIEHAASQIKHSELDINMNILGRNKESIATLLLTDPSNIIEKEKHCEVCKKLSENGKCMKE